VGGRRLKIPRDSVLAPIVCPVLRFCIKKESEVKVMAQFKERVNLLIEIKLKGQLGINKTEFKESEGIGETCPTSVA